MDREIIRRDESRNGDALVITPEVKGGLRLLVVEDDRTLREGLALTLRTEGYPVSTAATGEDALRTLAHTRFDIVITDLHLAEVSGLEVLQAARRAHPAVIVVVVTGDPSLPVCLGAVRSGAWDCLPKPFSAGHLAGLLDRAVRHIVTRTDIASSAMQERLVTEFERAYIGRLVGDAGGSLERAARLARIDRAALEALMEKHGLGPSAR